ncbi:MAG: 1,4-beta-xylanase [Rhodoglobus sp.]
MTQGLATPVNGMTWGWTGIRGSWATRAAEDSMAAMLELDANWVAIAFAALQETPQSTAIPFEAEPTVTDDELRWAIRTAKGIGLKVCLKPVVNVANGTWRGFISFFDWDVPGEPNWTDWFAAYTRFIAHYAAIAEAEGCELFCIGCEMVMTDKRDAEWRELIRRVREIYSGPITYNCDKYQEDHVTWWDAVDVVSSSGYYRIGQWQEQLDRIEKVVEATGKPFIFMEAGCPSRDGSANRPNDWTLAGAPSEEEQARYYEDMLSACAARPWVGGFMLRDWPAELYPVGEASTNDDYCVYGKQAAGVIRRHYSG